MEELFGDVIYAYTRAQAIDDGVLVDVTETAAEAGFVWPVAITRSCWNLVVEVPEGATCQDEAGRLWDVLWMARWAVRSSRIKPGDPLLFSVLAKVRMNGSPLRTRRVTLKALAGPGDSAEPVVTIMLPDES